MEIDPSAARALNPPGANNISLAAAGERHTRSSRVSKSWIGSPSDLSKDAANDASAAGINEDEAMKIVACTTRFATGMCVIIAIVKVSIYLKTKQDVVRTSALDSLGDLLANCISLYTGYRMTKHEPQRYPMGQGKFANIGCLVFSTFMFSLMFGNALGNVEGLIESSDEIGQAAISRFFWQTPALKGDFEVWRKELSINEEDEFVWTDKETGALEINNEVKVFFDRPENDNEGEKKMAAAMPGKVTRGEMVKQCAKYENADEQWEELMMQNQFLGLCATYKLFLWLYCIKYAIPKSKSSVLVALANDKKNDFICTYSVIFVTTCAFLILATEKYAPYLEMIVSEEKVDPLVSFILSIFIMKSWVELMVEHMVILSQESGSCEFCDGVRQLVMQSTHGSQCSVRDADDIKVFHSSEKMTIQVTLTVSDENTPFANVSKTTRSLKMKLESLPDVERVTILTTASVPSAGV